MHTAHVFIVDHKTFSYHLEYLFAGTGAKDSSIDFNGCPHTQYPQKENMLVSMMSDACRIRKGDPIIFYLQQSLEKGIREGRFFGLFKAAQDHSFLDNNDNDQYLKKELGKSLTFRTRIQPAAVYPEGVTEWEALDEIRSIRSPNQMLWSLIYRKLKGNRGNTMITLYEAERLCQLIRNKNRNNPPLSQNDRLSFDVQTQRIIAKPNYPPFSYEGRQEPLNIVPRFLTKLEKRLACEVHLQCYITQYIGLGENASLDRLLLEGDALEWLGNEVSCGVGMQRIDIMLSRVRDSEKIVVPIELKIGTAKTEHLSQIQRYVEWIRQYYIPNRPSTIQPVLAAKGRRNLPVQDVDAFNRANGVDCRPLLLLNFLIVNGDIVFNRV